MHFFTLLLLISTTLQAKTTVVRNELPAKLQRLVAASDGRIGICALELSANEATCVHGDQRFPLQSVMKLVVAAAVMDAVDRGRMRLDAIVVVKPQDTSPGPQEFADLVRSKGQLPTTVEELMRRAVVDSDSTGVDVLVERLGGAAAVQAFLKRKGFEGIRIDRDERHLQAESLGLTWRTDYADNRRFEAAVREVSSAARDAAAKAYASDPRDTATPMGMVAFLKALASGQLLSPTSTSKLLSVMEATATGKDRLRAGLPQGWSLGHKTGTSRTWRGVTAVTNDVGILTAPEGAKIAVAVFVAESKGSDRERAAAIANVARSIARAYGGKSVASVLETATFAGGCFWCMVSEFKGLAGVKSVISGYAGGTVKNPTYEQVSTGTTGHVEAVQIQFAPTEVSYEALLDTYWSNIDPEDAAGQFCDHGPQYRSAIFVHTDAQGRSAAASKERLAKDKKFKRGIATEIRKFTNFYPAETHHQDYFEKKPEQYKRYRAGCGRDRRLKDLWGEPKIK